MHVCRQFQFTQPKRAATGLEKHISPVEVFQFTQPKRAATYGTGSYVQGRNRCFNSRSPNGLRQPRGGAKVFHPLFQFTQPKRAATGGCSIGSCCGGGFNSRSPNGLRQSEESAFLFSEKFQFTQPKRAATGHYFAKPFGLLVSIHAAQTGCDLRKRDNNGNGTFQFTQPKRAATSRWLYQWAAREFQFTQPKRAATIE